LIVSEVELLAKVTRDRAAGKRIAVAALTFDLLRVADVRRLQIAATAADRLVVAVVDDRAVHATTVQDRAELVDSLRGVDYVITCAEDRVPQLVELLMPDVRA